MKSEKGWLDMVREAFFLALLLGLVFFIWMYSYRIFVKACAVPIQPLDQGDLSTVLFGTASIALFILSLIVAVLAILGWQSIKDHVGKKVEEVTKEKVQLLENELRGRVLTTLGYALGEMSVKPGTFEPGDKERLVEAVNLCRLGYEHLKKVGGPAEYLALNNLLFYSSVYGDQSDKADKDFMLREARRLRDVGQEHDSVFVQLTACRVLLEYRAGPDEEAKAREVLRALVEKRSRISEREKREARFYLERYP